jgi:hypothetical protein
VEIWKRSSGVTKTLKSDPDGIDVVKRDDVGSHVDVRRSKDGFLDTGERRPSPVWLRRLSRGPAARRAGLVEHCLKI